MTRIVFAGTPGAAVPALRALVAAGHEVPLVVTRPDAPLGRKRVLTPSPVAQAARELGLDTLKTSRMDEAAVARLSAVGPDLGVVVAYGALLPDVALDAPSRGWVNVHFSLLPRWRGAAPVQRAMAAGEPQGYSLMRLVPELDAGPVWVSERVPGAEEGTAGEALELLADAGAAGLISALPDILDGREPTAQDGEATYARKLTREDGRLDLTAPAEEVGRRVRAMTPEPGAWVLDGDAVLKVLEARPAHGAPRLEPGEARRVGAAAYAGAADGAIELVTVQPAGKRPMRAADWLNGRGGAVKLS